MYNSLMNEQLMTAEEFISYAREYLFGEDSECLFERIAEHNSEVAAFGDAGPGSGYRLRQSIDEYNRIADRYEKLTGDKVQFRPMIRAPR